MLSPSLSLSHTHTHTRSQAERELAAGMFGAGDDDAGAATAADTNAAEQQRAAATTRLAALAGEAAAVRAALDALGDADDGAAAGGGCGGPQADEDAWSDEEGGEAAQPGPSHPPPRPAPPASSLQRALLTQRLAGLAGRRDMLERALAEGRDVASPRAAGAGGAGAAHPPPAPRPDRPATAPPMPVPDDSLAAALAAAGPGGGLVETERDRLIRLGVLTPFDAVGGLERRAAGAGRGPAAAGAGGGDNEFLPAATPADAAAAAAASTARLAARYAGLATHRHRAVLLDPAAAPPPERATLRVGEAFWRGAASGGRRPTGRRGGAAEPASAAPAPAMPVGARQAMPVEIVGGGRAKRRRTRSGGGGGEGEEEEEEEGGGAATAAALEEDADAAALFDDAHPASYRARLAAAGIPLMPWCEEGGARPLPLAVPAPPRPARGDARFDGGFLCPASAWGRLLPYQRTGVRWLWELHAARAGGILADEMGLGKTVQVAALLAGLHASGLLGRPSLLVAPATLLNQWVRELRAWAPALRVIVLHGSARSRDRGGGGAAAPRGAAARAALVREGTARGPRPSALASPVPAGPAGAAPFPTAPPTLLITSYEGLRRGRADLLTVRWGLAVLDEGHAIRNPDADVTLAAKGIATAHRLLLSGAPVQNSLAELWSLMDFVVPGRLGTLPVFTAELALPIQAGGYAGASPLQAATAVRCAVTLRDLVGPYLLRRRKADVASSLPSRTERVLFCRLLPAQRELYRAYLASQEVQRHKKIERWGREKRARARARAWEKEKEKNNTSLFLIFS